LRFFKNYSGENLERFSFALLAMRFPQAQKLDRILRWHLFLCFLTKSDLSGFTYFALGAYKY
jgi:hypothetical protein